LRSSSTGESNGKAGEKTGSGGDGNGKVKTGGGSGSTGGLQEALGLLHLNRMLGVPGQNEVGKVFADVWTRHEKQIHILQTWTK